MEFCECNSGKYRWRDVAFIYGAYYDVDEEVYMCEDGTIEVGHIVKKLSQQHGAAEKHIYLSTSVEGGFPPKVIEAVWGDKKLGGYCAVCGKYLK